MFDNFVAHFIFGCGKDVFQIIYVETVVSDVKIKFKGQGQDIFQVTRFLQNVFDYFVSKMTPFFFLVSLIFCLFF